MLDLKKLITGFLILAAGASSSAIILSNIGNPSPSQTTAQTAQTSTTPTLAGSAFAQMPDTGTALDGTETSTEQDDPTNLTDGMADAFVNSIVAANPNGIQTDANGNAEITPPDSQTITSALEAEPAFQNVAVPDWDTEVVTLQNEIKIVPYATTSITDYITNFDNVINGQLVKTGLAAMAENGAMPADESAVVASGASAASNTLAAVLNFSTPAPFVNFQKSFIKLLVYQRDEAQLAEGNSQDPAMTAAVIQAKANDYQEAAAEFQTQSQTLDDLLNSYGNAPSAASGPLSFVDKIFFINQAEATGLPVTDWLQKLETALIGAQATQNAWVVYFTKVAQDMALQIGKNIIMAIIQQKVLAYIQNSGAPRFVTNWGTEAVQAGETSAINAINSNFACISPSGALSGVQIVLNAIYKPGNGACASAFASNLANGVTPQQFYNNFSNGGFLAFGQTLQPSQNFYGGLFASAQTAGQSSQQSQNLFTLKTSAGQGYRPAQVCADGSNPNGFHCIRPDGSTYNVSTAACNDGGTGTDILILNDGGCTNGGEPSVTMPAIINTEAMDSSLGSSKALISAANSLAGLAQFAAQDLLMGLVNQGIQSVTKLANGMLQGSQSNPGLNLSTSAITTATPTSTEITQLSCRPTEVDVQMDGQTPATFEAIGGTYDLNANPPTYTWTSSDGQTGTGSEFDVLYNALGTYTVTLSDSAGDSPATCTAVVAPQSTSTLQVNVNVTVTSTATSTGN